MGLLSPVRAVPSGLAHYFRIPGGYEKLSGIFYHRAGRFAKPGFGVTPAPRFRAGRRGRGAWAEEPAPFRFSPFPAPGGNRRIPLIFAAPGQDLPKFAMLMAGPGKMWYAEPWRGFLRRASGLDLSGKWKIS